MAELKPMPTTAKTAQGADPATSLNPQDYFNLVRDALHPDERKFMKTYLGQETPDLVDYVTQQGRDRFHQARELRRSITEKVLNNLIPSETNPAATLGQARSIDPDFPAPPGAVRKTMTPQYGEAAGPGAPVPFGEGGHMNTPPPMQPGVMPGLSQPVNNPQGMEAQPTMLPPGQSTLPGAQPPGFSGNYQMGPDESGWEPKGPIPDHNAPPQATASPSLQRMVEGPRPTTPVPSMVEGTEEDMGALLPRSHQNLLVAKTHKQGLRGFAPGSNWKGDAWTRLKELRSGSAQEEYQGEMTHLVGLFDKDSEPAPGSDKARKLKAEADLKEKQVEDFDSTSEVKKRKLGTSADYDEARTREVNQLRDAKLTKLEAMTTLAIAKAQESGHASNVLKGQELKAKLAAMKTLMPHLDEAGRDTLMNSILEETDIEVGHGDPGFVDKFLNRQGPLTVKPKAGGTPTSKAKVPAKESTSSSPKPPPDWANGMKDGEERLDPSGKRHKRVGNTLQPVE